jgi:hypothetical protein
MRPKPREPAIREDWIGCGPRPEFGQLPHAEQHGLGAGELGRIRKGRGLSMRHSSPPGWFENIVRAYEDG